MLTAVALYFFARCLFGGVCGVVALLFFALSPLHIQMSQEIRMYPLLYLLAVLSVHTFYLYSRSENPVWGGAHLIVNALLVWTHMLAPALVVAEAAYLLLCRPIVPRRIVAWLVAHAAVGIGLVCWIATIDMNDFERSAGWIELPCFEDLVLALSAVRTYAWQGAERFPLLQWVFLVPVCIVAARAARSREDAGLRRKTLLVLLWLVVPTLALFALSYVLTPCMVRRYTRYSSFALYIIVGAVLAMPGKQRWRVLGVGAVATLLTINLACTSRPFPHRLEALRGHYPR